LGSAMTWPEILGSCEICMLRMVLPGTILTTLEARCGEVAGGQVAAARPKPLVIRRCSICARCPLPAGPLPAARCPEMLGLCGGPAAPEALGLDAQQVCDLEVEVLLDGVELVDADGQRLADVDRVLRAHLRGRGRAGQGQGQGSGCGWVWVWQGQRGCARRALRWAGWHMAAKGWGEAEAWPAHLEGAAACELDRQLRGALVPVERAVA
jgi:hypothetical protein